MNAASTKLAMIWVWTIIWSCIALTACDKHKAAELPPTEQPDPQSLDEPPEYVSALKRTAVAAQMDPDALRGDIRRLANTCRRSKREMYIYLRSVARQTGDLAGAIETAPAFCQRAAQFDRPMADPSTPL